MSVHVDIYLRNQDKDQITSFPSFLSATNQTTFISKALNHL